MYLINDFQLQTINSASYIFNDSKAAKIPNDTLYQILETLKQQKQLEINETSLEAIATRHRVPLEQLKHVLITQLDILRPLAFRKFHNLYLNVDDPQICGLLSETFQAQYTIHVVKQEFRDYKPSSLVIYYRNNYSNPDFKRIYHDLPNDVYLITAGLLHKILVIDNLYFNDSGLPTHLSNLHQLMAFLNSDMPATKDNWLLFYRSMVKNNVDVFPEPVVNACQKGFIAYSLFQFASQYTQFWKAPMPLDKINWFWHVDLTSFSVHQEVAIHSAFSEYDMKLDVNHLTQTEPA
ncbi:MULTISPECIES: hypothetical protein [unclassified Legionella]|uniref:hypothetical protein n=1 Tax=unclassified Legionella TaxID=2622702 RepID=UPI0010561DBB|nr:MULTISPECIES: hypothetical protein [unclassified Legionella]MDI9817799.1 hypothetical protein [Legionella sp. PL877]